MERFFLVDTNVWISLLTEDKKRYLLNSLQKLTSEKKITLLVPAILLREWNLQKEIQLELFKKTHSATLNVATHSGMQSIKPQLMNEIEEVKRKIQEIDFLLTEGIQIKISAKVKTLTIDRTNLRLAPFHNKITSLNDCQLYFSAIEYLRKRRITEFFFITKNTKDFSNPEKPADELHVDLLVEGLKICYFTELGKCFQNFKEEFLLSDKGSLSGLERTFIITLIERGQRNLLNHLHATLMKAREQVEFIPTAILVRLNPFRIKNPERDYSYYAGFSLHTNNEELFNLFKCLEVGLTIRFKKGAEYGNTIRNIQMVSEVVQMLNANHVFSITSLHTGEEVNIKRIETHTCECSRCCFLRLELQKAFQKATAETEDISDKIKSAFVLFQLGAYDKSFKKFHEVYTAAKENGQNLIAFRMACNLNWTRAYASFYSQPEMTELYKEINAINLDKEYYNFVNASEYDQEIASFYHQAFFHYEYADEIAKHCDKIKEHYELQLRGGYSNNSNYSNLLSRYSEYESFISINCITFFKFSNFDILFKKYQEAVFLSLFLNEYQSSRLLGFDDYTLTRLIFFGSAKEMIKLHNRNTKGLIKYIPTENKNEFEQLVNTFFNSDASFRHQLETFGKWNDFRNSYDNIFQNILILLSLIEIDGHFLKKITKAVYLFLKQNKPYPYNVENINFFIKRCRSILNKQQLYQFFRLFLEDDRYHHQNMFYAFRLDKKKGCKFQIDREEDFELLVATYFEKCSKCNSSHTESLYSLYFCLSPKFQKQLREKIETKLTKELDVQMYYNTAIRGVIDYRKYFDEYLNSFIPPKEKSAIRNFFSSGEISHHRFNELFNLVFKYDISLSQEFLNKFKGMSSYYDWLIDMRTFDYSKFNPLWINEYSTSYYLQRIFKVPQVRIKVKEYLQNNYHPTLARYYVEFSN